MVVRGGTSWQGNPGRRPGLERPIEKLCSDLEDAHAWMRTDPAFHRLRPDRRVQKKLLAKRIGMSRPTLNKSLQGSGAPYPFPTPDQLVWVVDIDDSSALWVNAAVATTLQHPRDWFIGRDAREAFHPGIAGNEMHRREIEAMIRGELDVHECTTTFVRADGELVSLDIRVRYGPEYRVWFAVGELEFQPTLLLAEGAVDLAS